MVGGGATGESWGSMKARGRMYLNDVAKHVEFCTVPADELVASMKDMIEHAGPFFRHDNDRRLSRAERRLVALLLQSCMVSPGWVHDLCHSAMLQDEVRFPSEGGNVAMVITVPLAEDVMALDFIVAHLSTRRPPISRQSKVQAKRTPRNGGAWVTAETIEALVVSQILRPNDREW